MLRTRYKPIGVAMLFAAGLAPLATFGSSSGSDKVKKYKLSESVAAVGAWDTQRVAVN
jgi:hypothetical protein